MLVIEVAHLLPLNVKKHNIGSKEKPKLASIRDYWDDQKIKDRFDLLTQYEDLFPLSVVELKGINGGI